MKTKFSRKLISFLLAILMVATTVPASATTAFAGTDGCKYLFAYFTGNSRLDQKIRFAVSTDGYNYTKINGGNPVLKQTKFTNETSDGYARDPYIFPSHDGSKYYILATDLDASGLSGDPWAGDSCFVMWESTDLCTWTQMPVIDARTFSNANVPTNDFATTIRAWAPQVIWDSNVGQYMFYWSQYFGDWQDQGIYYSYTSDFQTFTAPKLLYAPTGCYGIDADIQYVNGTYYIL